MSFLARLRKAARACYSPYAFKSRAISSISSICKTRTRTHIRTTKFQKYQSHFKTSPTQTLFSRFASFSANQTATYTQQNRAIQIDADTKEIPPKYQPDPEIGKRSTFSITTTDYPGALAQMLRILTENDVNMTRIESRYGQKATQVNFIIDCDVPVNHRRVAQALPLLRQNSIDARLVPSIKVPWFPVTAQEVDSVALLVLDESDLEADHPGFHDQEYKKRRAKITESAQNFTYGDVPMTVDYSPQEIECWSKIWMQLKPKLYEHGCSQYIAAFDGLVKHCGYKKDKIPQLSDVSAYLLDKTGIKLRPTAGLLSSRHFLNGLAFNTFFCTQYLRHHSVPFYTPEPDVVHELVGHAPMFADPEFAKFSQEIGLASIGATDGQIEELARCYWFSVEFGLCKDESGDRKVYGAGILSSYGEIDYCMSEEPEVRKWNPWNASKQTFPITKYQPVYYLADGFDDATRKMRGFANSLDKPFTCRWNDVKERLSVDRNVQRMERKEDDYGEYIGEAE